MLDLHDCVEEETLLVHPDASQNTIEARAMVRITTPDGVHWEGDRVIKIRMKRIPNNG